MLSCVGLGHLCIVRRQGEDQLTKLSVFLCWVVMVPRLWVLHVPSPATVHHPSLCSDCSFCLELPPLAPLPWRLSAIIAPYLPLSRLNPSSVLPSSGYAPRQVCMHVQKITEAWRGSLPVCTWSHLHEVLGCLPQHPAQVLEFTGKDAGCLPSILKTAEPVLTEHLLHTRHLWPHLAGALLPATILQVTLN